MLNRNFIIKFFEGGNTSLINQEESNYGFFDYMYPTSSKKSNSNQIIVNKTNRTLTYNGKTYRISISKNGLDDKLKDGDGFTPEGIFSGIIMHHKNGYKDKSTGMYRPNAYGNLNKCIRLYGKSNNGLKVQKYGILIHGSDAYNDPDNYGKYFGKNFGKGGTHGCVAMKNNDLAELIELIGNKKVNIKITR